ncbi:MAG TPA: outer membrane beta-barrel protein [Acidobacteriaceae bacterium]|nr:outer membrane beta-barrel protein [Acidobacteriaceae bacterium]
MSRTALTVLLGLASPLFSQAIPTASRVADVQVGAGYAAGSPDYIHRTFPGITAYADVDLRSHFGGEMEFHDIFDSQGSGMAQRTYELGARYLRTYGPLVPYAKGLFGIGQFKYPQGLTVLDYWMFAGGGGIDYKLTERIHLRGEYEYQKWISFPNGGLHPQIVTFAVAYHFPGTLRRR